MSKHTKKYLASAVTAALASSIGTSIANANENPFQMTPLNHGYMIADTKGQTPPDDDTKREGSVGDDKLGSGQCGEGQCGTNAKSGEGNLKGSKGENKLGSGQCGEGQCGTDAVKK